MCCLASLRDLDYSSYDVVVFDNASVDGSQDAVSNQYPELDLVCSDINLGPGGGRNAAVDYAKSRYPYEYILFLDDDAEVTPCALQHLVDGLENDKDAGMACGKTFSDIDENQIATAGITERFYLASCQDRGAGEYDTGKFEVTEYVDACSSCAFLIGRSVFEQLGGFDPVYNTYGFEDTDLGLRARRVGIRTLYVHTAIFVHRGTKIGRAPIAGYERNKVKNYMILLTRHMTLPQKLCSVVALPLRALWLAIGFARNGQWSIISAQVRGAMDYLGRRT
jgi:GT2 family glycosyltransferase